MHHNTIPPNKCTLELWQRSDTCRKCRLHCLFFSVLLLHVKVPFLWQWKYSCSCSGSKLVQRSVWPPVAHSSDLFSCWVGPQMPIMRSGVPSSKVMDEEHGSSVMQLLMLTVSCLALSAEAGAFRLRPTHRSANKSVTHEAYQCTCLHKPR